MNRSRLLLILVTLVTVEVGGVALSLIQPSPLMLGLLIGVPLLLGAAVWIGQRWVGLACVLYGTVGLALDLATAVHMMTKSAGEPAVLVHTGISGLVNVLLLVSGGRTVLDADPAPRPPGSRPPNPPFPFSSLRA